MERETLIREKGILEGELKQLREDHSRCDGLRAHIEKLEVANSQLTKKNEELQKEVEDLRKEVKELKVLIEQLQDDEALLLAAQLAWCVQAQMARNVLDDTDFKEFARRARAIDGNSVIPMNLNITNLTTFKTDATLTTKLEALAKQLCDVKAPNPVEDVKTVCVNITVARRVPAHPTKRFTTVEEIMTYFQSKPSVRPYLDDLSRYAKFLATERQGRELVFNSMPLP